MVSCMYVRTQAWLCAFYLTACLGESEYLYVRSGLLRDAVLRSGSVEYCVLIEEQILPMG